MRQLSYLLVTVSLSMISVVCKADSICSVLKQHPAWLQAVQDTAKQWGIPANVQLAIVKEESDFQANAKNPESTATGFAQVIDKSWDAYETATDHQYSRNDFRAAIGYIGWYAAQVQKYAKVNPSNAFGLYLAYHEGIGGYHHLATHPKPDVTRLAQNVAENAQLYSQQLVTCS